MNHMIKMAGFCYKTAGIGGIMKLVKRKLFHLNYNVIYEIMSHAAPEKYPVILKEKYLLRTGKQLNLDQPVTYNDKIAWLKLHDTTGEKTRLADKYLVREWVADTIGAQCLIPIYGVWDSFREIDFDKLPDQFVLKCNHASGYNIIVQDKSKFDKAAAGRKFDKWMNTNWAYFNLELQYRDIPRKIIAEKYCGEIDADFTEYHIYCFNGTPGYIEILTGQKHGRKSVFVDTDWVRADIRNPSMNGYDGEIVRPANYQKILETAGRLAGDFKFVRVDLYSDNVEAVFFGEMTFTPRGDGGYYEPQSVNMLFGSLIDLENAE